MILMFLLNPVAFVAAILSGMGVVYGYELTGHGTPHDGVITVSVVIAYLIAMWLLPWWCKPAGIWRWWRNR
jgi:hypothetical protein